MKATNVSEKMFSEVKFEEYGVRQKLKNFGNTDRIIILLEEEVYLLEKHRFS